MADFCKACSEEVYGKDFHDLANISTSEDTKNGLFACVLCEGCGSIQVNHLGECVTPDCFRKNCNGHGVEQ